MNAVSEKIGEIVYLGQSAFQIGYEGQKLLLNPHNRLFQVDNDNLNSRGVEPVDFIVIYNSDFNAYDTLRILLDANQQSLIIAPKTLLQKIKEKIRIKNGNPPHTLALDEGETIRFTFFTVKSLQSGREKGSAALSIHCGNLDLFFANRGFGDPEVNMALNAAILPLNDSRYNDPAALTAFEIGYKPDIIMFYPQDTKQKNKLTQNLGQNSISSKIHFPQIGEKIPWN